MLVTDKPVDMARFCKQFAEQLIHLFTDNISERERTTVIRETLATAQRCYAGFEDRIKSVYFGVLQRPDNLEQIVKFTNGYDLQDADDVLALKEYSALLDTWYIEACNETYVEFMKETGYSLKTADKVFDLLSEYNKVIHDVNLHFDRAVAFLPLVLDTLAENPDYDRATVVFIKDKLNIV